MLYLITAALALGSMDMCYYFDLRNYAVKIVKFLVFIEFCKSLEWKKITPEEQHTELLRWLRELISTILNAKFVNSSSDQHIFCAKKL